MKTATRIEAFKKRVTGKGFRAFTYPRAALIGNPSDHFNGKVIAFTFTNFSASCTIKPSDKLTVVPPPTERPIFDSADHFIHHHRLYGYDGSERLVRASLKVIFEKLRSEGVNHIPNFSVEIFSNIPRSVGLSGSTALSLSIFKVVAAVAKHRLSQLDFAELAYRTENEELSNPLGYQDPVSQSFGGMTFMDFSNRTNGQRAEHGTYEPVVPHPKINFYIAYDQNGAEVSGVAKRNLRKLYEEGDEAVLAARSRYIEIVDAARQALTVGDSNALHHLINEGYDLRKTIMNVAETHDRMIRVARHTGASATFAGSGGTIVGTFSDEQQFRELRSALKRIGVVTFKPTFQE